MGAVLVRGDPLSVRFWRMVEQGDPERCWHFQGYCAVTNGYGRYRVRPDEAARSGPVEAHRIAFFLHHGYWPTIARHTCDNPPCCNPHHLIDGEIADNVRDAIERGRYPVGEARLNAVLTTEQVRVIRANPDGLSFAALAEQYRVSASTIGRIRNGATWKHVA